MAAKADFESRAPRAVRDSDALWHVLINEPGVGVSIVDGEGDVLYANEQAVSIFLEDSHTNPVGMSLRDLLPRAVVEERMELFQRIIQTHKPLIIRHIHLGKRVQSTIWPLCPENHPPKFLIISRINPITVDDPSDGFEVFESEHADFGPLDVLTKRELEVLALIGQGLTIAEIGQTLHRSPKTIEKHRESMARKLNARNRVELAQIANQLGLQLEDAHLHRLS